MKTARTQEDIRKDQRTGARPMPREKIQVFMEECPFIIPQLTKLFPWFTTGHIHSIYMSAMTEEIILKVVTKENDRGEEICLLDSQGGEITVVQETAPLVFKKFLLWGPPYWEWKFGSWQWPARTSRHCPSIMKVLKALGSKASQVAFALSVDTRTMSVILYRRMKDMNLENWVSEYDKRCAENEKMEIEELRQQLRDDLKIN